MHDIRSNYISLGCCFICQPFMDNCYTRYTTKVFISCVVVNAYRKVDRLISTIAGSIIERWELVELQIFVIKIVVINSKANKVYHSRLQWYYVL
jgi:hypothetical protein